MEEELAQVKADSAEQEKDLGEPLACLGQESANVAALKDLLLQHGVDPSGILAQVRAPSVFHMGSFCSFCKCQARMLLSLSRS